MITSYRAHRGADGHLVQNIATTDKPQQVGNDGQIFTSMPEMLFQVVTLQAGVVKGRLEAPAAVLILSSKLSAEQARQFKCSTTREALCGANAGGGGGGGGGGRRH